MSQGLPADVQAFVTDHIFAIEQLEVLLLLHKEPSRRWTIDGLSVELRSSPRSIRQRLDDLCALRLAQRVPDTDFFQYHVSDTRLGEIVSELALLYRPFRLAVMELIFQKPKSKMLTFSRAFRLKGDDDGG